MYCSISGSVPRNPVVSIKSGLIFDLKSSFFPIHNVSSCIVTVDVASKDENIVATGSNDGQVVVFDRSQTRVLASCTHGEEKITSVHFASHPQTLISCSVDGNVILWQKNDNFGYHPRRFTIIMLKCSNP